MVKIDVENGYYLFKLDDLLTTNKISKNKLMKETNTDFKVLQRIIRGDLAKIDEEGYIFICGRKKSVIVLKNGKNIFPEEMENLVNKIEGVSESMIYPVLNKDAKDENDIRVFTEIVYDKEIMKEMYNTEDEKEIFDIINNKIKEINRTMPLYKSIRGIVLTEEPIAKTTTGKLKRYEELAKIKARENN